MNYTKKEREYYNIQRDKTCLDLGITKNQYNWLRRQGEKLHKIYEDNCNGHLDEVVYQNKCSAIEKQIEEYISGGEKYYVFYQTDPRGATIYLDLKEIPDNNYTQAYCIY